MHWRTWIASAILFTNSALGQKIGQVTVLDLEEGQATLRLDFSDRDYELILYSTATETEDSNLTFRYSVSGPATSVNNQGTQNTNSIALTDRNRLENSLREEEKQLATSKKHKDAQSTIVRRSTSQPSPEQLRTFAFNAFGEIMENQTVEAILVASSSRAVAYLDKTATSSIALSIVDIEAMLDTFSNSTYPTVTEVFGEPSDVDEDGKVLFLFTPLVDQVGGIRGFYRAQSLFSVDDGGDGNQADMMYISPTHTADSYPALLAHEFQHLINYNQHSLVRDGQAELNWLNEALSHVTEDLMGRHVQGSNPELVRTYLAAPQNYSLTGSAAFNEGIRGAGYLFLRGLIEDFGEDILSSLTQTALIGRQNVEEVTGNNLLDLYKTFSVRTFLSGTGLAPEFNYEFPFFTEPSTERRTLPMPMDENFTFARASLSGQLRPTASAYIRLTGGETRDLVTIETETEGSFRALLIPLPQDFQPPLALATDYFQAVAFDTPLQASHTSGISKRISGSVATPSVSRLLFQFNSLEENKGAEGITFAFDVKNGRFARSILFHPSHAGTYELQILSSHEGESDSLLGKFSPITVNEGSGTVNFPVDFFSGLTLDSVLPTVVPAGEGVWISGAISDPLISQISFSFRPLGGTGKNVDFAFDTNDGRFGRSIVFHPSQAGDYELRLLIAKNGDLPTIVERFSTVAVTEGSGKFEIPVDFFQGVIMDTPFPGVLSAADGIRISGTIPNPAITEILYRFRPIDDGGGGDNADFSFDVIHGRYGRSIVFNPSQVGNYELMLFKGQKGEPLSFYDKFSPITIEGSGTLGIPVDFFQNVIFDVPLSSVLSTGKGIRISGTISDPLVTQLLASFRPLGGTGEIADFFLDVTDGRFGRSIVFNPSQVEDYELILFMGQKGKSLTFVDRFSPITLEGSGPVNIPVDFFQSVIFDVPLASVLPTGEGIRILGAISDPLVSQLLISFRPIGVKGENVDFSFDVTDGRFGRSIVFHPSQLGEYELNLFTGEKGESLPFAGSFSPITISEGSETVQIPVDYFPDLILDAPMPAMYSAGNKLRLSGTVSDPSITQILFSFNLPEDDEAQPVRFFIPVTNARFDHNITFEPFQANDYELLLFMGKQGEPLQYSGGFAVFTVNPPIPPSIIGTKFHDDGSFELTVHYQLGIRVDIEVSTDLKNWILLPENDSISDGEQLIRDEHASEFHHRFYRIKSATEF